MQNSLFPYKTFNKREDGVLLTSFALIPNTDLCPYLEASYNVETEALGIVMKAKINRIEMLPRLDNEGNPMQRKKTSQSQTPYQLERVFIEMNHVVRIFDKEEVMRFVEETVDMVDQAWIKELVYAEYPPLEVSQNTANVFTPVAPEA